MSTERPCSPAVADLSEADVYRAIAHDPETTPGIYVDAVAATPDGLTVTLSDELDQSAAFTLTIAPQRADRGPLLAERYGNLAALFQEAPR